MDRAQRRFIFSLEQTHSAGRMIDFLALKKMGLETFEADVVEAYCYGG